MSDHVPQPGPDDAPDDSGQTPFDFGSLNVENSAESLFSTPNVKAGKRRWWQSKPKEPRARKAPKTMPTAPRGGLKNALEQLYTGVGMSVMPFDPSCARVIMENASACAESLDELSKTNPALRRMLINIVSVSAFGTVIMAHAPIVMAIAMHHVPALKERQEAMIGDIAEAMANMNVTPDENGDGSP